MGSSSTEGDVAYTPGSSLIDISAETRIAGNLEIGGDKDVYSLSVTAGGTY